MAAGTFKKKGKAYLGHAVGVKLSSGTEVILFCPTAVEAEVAAATMFPAIPIDPKEIKPAVLGPRSLIRATPPKNEG